MDRAPVQTISEYAFLSDCRTSAMVSREGSIDWYCPGRFDAPSVFARLLDPQGGHWVLRPDEESRASRAYAGPGLILRTEHRTKGGRVAVTDALVQGPGTAAHSLGVSAPGVLVRRVEGISGRVSMALDLQARPEYGLATPLVRQDPAGATSAAIQAGPLDLRLTGSVGLTVEGSGISAGFEIAEGERLTFALEAGSAYRGDRDGPGFDPEAALDATFDAWQAWADAHGTYRGVAREQVERSAAVLQGLTYGPSGALLAAATTSLPERIGGDWNWDYRFAWLRDAGLMMRAQWVAACPDEPGRFFEWLVRSIGPDHRAPVQIVFGAEGERRLDEAELPWLGGFAGSSPVRIGNDAWKQRQHDVMGEVLDIALLLRDQLGETDRALHQLLTALADEAAEQWDRPDAGMWEARDEERHYVSSQVMCWVALDRAIQLDIGREEDRERWRSQRARIHDHVLKEGWNETVGAFTGAIGSDELDASVLLLPVVGFLPMDDERMRRTVQVIEEQLSTEGLVRRWGDDPNGFLICSYWLVECLALSGETERARTIFDRVTALGNDLGLLSEMADTTSGQLLGNVPQAFSHAGLINAAWRLSEGKAPGVQPGAQSDEAGGD